MYYPTTRLRRLRKSKNLRSLVRETEINVQDLIYPLFITDGNGIREEIESMPGIYRQSLESALEEIEESLDLGIRSILLFGIPDTKDPIGTGSFKEDGIIQRSVSEIKKRFKDLIVVTDVCMCEYTDHGHCGIIKDNTVDNDDTLPYLAEIALSHAKSGADIIAPSDMMDGRVSAIRNILDENGFSHTPIMSYSAKYASSFYGPFRDAAGSTPQFGDRRGYQMDPPNVREALREIALDIEEGADIVMVKPALGYLDVIRAAREEFSLPLAAYNVSGEYSMVKAAAKMGWIDENRMIMEIMIGIKRAGADIVITYHAKEVAKILKEQT